MVSKSPVLLPGLTPVVKTKHNGEGAGGQQLLVVVVVQTVGSSKDESVSNLGGGECWQKSQITSKLMILKQSSLIVFMNEESLDEMFDKYCTTHQHRRTRAVDIALFGVFIPQNCSNPGVSPGLEKRAFN